jgi:hypothetical protein
MNEQMAGAESAPASRDRLRASARPPGYAAGGRGPRGGPARPGARAVAAADEIGRRATRHRPCRLRSSGETVVAVPAPAGEAE